MQIEGFEISLNPLYMMKIHLEDLRYCLKPRSRACLEVQGLIKNEKQAIRHVLRDGTSGWTLQGFIPEIDADNDGLPDPIILVTRYNRASSELRPSINAFVFDPSYEYLDMARTQAFFRRSSRRATPGPV